MRALDVDLEPAIGGTRVRVQMTLSGPRESGDLLGLECTDRVLIPLLLRDGNSNVDIAKRYTPERPRTLRVEPGGGDWEGRQISISYLWPAARNTGAFGGLFLPAALYLPINGDGQDRALPALRVRERVGDGDEPGRLLTIRSTTGDSALFAVVTRSLVPFLESDSHEMFVSPTWEQQGRRLQSATARVASVLEGVRDALGWPVRARRLALVLETEARHAEGRAGGVVIRADPGWFDDADGADWVPILAARVASQWWGGGIRFVGPDSELLIEALRSSTGMTIASAVEPRAVDDVLGRYRAAARGSLVAAVGSSLQGRVPERAHARQTLCLHERFEESSFRRSLSDFVKEFWGRVVPTSEVRNRLGI